MEDAPVADVPAVPQDGAVIPRGTMSRQVAMTTVVDLDESSATCGRSPINSCPARTRTAG